MQLNLYEIEYYYQASKMLSGLSRNINDGQTSIRGKGTAVPSFGRVEIVTWLWIVSTLITLAVSEQQQSRHYTQPMPFFLGSRYGRSGTATARGQRPVPKLLEVSPRVDRFFLGSRFGKRGLIDNNDNNEINDFEKLQPPSIRIPCLRKFEEVLGYLNRLQRAERIVRINDNDVNKYTNDKENEEVIPIDAPNDDESENIW